MVQITNVLVPALCRAIVVACIGMLVYLLPSLCFFIPFRWEEERYTDGVKWKFLEHKGPVFAPPYEPLPSSIKFYYDGTSYNETIAVLKVGRQTCSGVALIGWPSKLLEKQIMSTSDVLKDFSVCSISLLKAMRVSPPKLKFLYFGYWPLFSVIGFLVEGLRC